jgi:hypothetical protein
MKEEKMERRRRSSLVGGILLILIGAWFAALQLMPGLRAWFNIEVTWPLFIVAVGFILLVVGLVTASPGLAVPACIVGGLGGLFYWQATTGNWETWSFAWALIPSFVGVGVLLSGVLEGQTAKGVREGGWLILIGIVLFVIFGSVFGELAWLGPYWPLLVVAFGLLLVVQGLLRARR